MIDQVNVPEISKVCFLASQGNESQKFDCLQQTWCLAERDLNLFLFPSRQGKGPDGYNLTCEL